jgi:hypothetical protein
VEKWGRNGWGAAIGGLSESDVIGPRRRAISANQMLILLPWTLGPSLVTSSEACD